MEQKKSEKGLVNEKVTRHDGDSGTPQSLISSNHFTHLTHFKKAATQIIRGAAKVRFCRTLRAGLADARTAPYRKFGFTLAEVLVTLAVIGIVAVMTIPNMVQNYQSKAWNAADTVFQRKLTEALKVMNVQGTLAGYSSTEDFVTELSKHLKITKTCTNSNLTACFNDKVMWGKDDKSELTEVDISKLKTAKDFGQEDWNTNIMGFQLASGVTGLMAYNPGCKQDEYSNQVTGGDCLAVLYDVQGYSKPNTSSKDLRHQNVLALGNTKTCDVEFDNHCWTLLGVPTAISRGECEEMVKSGKYGNITVCPYDGDYWAGAVKQCGGTKNMPSMAQLAKLATQIYGQEIGEKDSPLGLERANIELFNTFAAKTSSSTSFSVWSNTEENSNSNAYAGYRYFFTIYTDATSALRNDSGNLAVCLND